MVGLSPSVAWATLPCVIAVCLDLSAQAIYEVARDAVRATRDPQLIRRLQACRPTTEKEPPHAKAPSRNGRQPALLPPPRVPAASQRLYEGAPTFEFQI